ncbi:MAG: hypothetical protein N2Z22_02025 [Turneriella sp.]|nr:hypothetical protein [Turneriella sp.]
MALLCLRLSRKMAFLRRNIQRIIYLLCLYALLRGYRYFWHDLRVAGDPHRYPEATITFNRQIHVLSPQQELRLTRSSAELSELTSHQMTAQDWLAQVEAMQQIQKQKMAFSLWPACK